MNILNSKKRAAMEMSIGTIVTLVLIVAFLIVGIYFLTQIKKGGGEAITGINQQIVNQINNLFAEDNFKKVIIYPTTKRISIQKGKDDLGFGFSIRNIETEEKSFSYEIVFEDATIDSMNKRTAEDLIALGREGSGITIPTGSIMEDPVFVRFDIGQSIPPCEIRYKLSIYDGRTLYSSPQYIDVRILPE
jgi:hypothetical protein